MVIVKQSITKSLSVTIETIMYWTEHTNIDAVIEPGCCPTIVMYGEQRCSFWEISVTPLMNI